MSKKTISIVKVEVNVEYILGMIIFKKVGSPYLRAISDLRMNKRDNIIVFN